MPHTQQWILLHAAEGLVSGGGGGGGEERSGRLLLLQLLEVVRPLILHLELEDKTYSQKRTGKERENASLLRILPLPLPLLPPPLLLLLLLLLLQMLVLLLLLRLLQLLMLMLLLLRLVLLLLLLLLLLPLLLLLLKNRYGTQPRRRTEDGYEGNSRRQKTIKNRHAASPLWSPPCP